MTDGAIKAGRRRSASDMAVGKAMRGDLSSYVKLMRGDLEDLEAKMSDYLKALGFQDEDGDGAVTLDEAVDQDEADAEIDESSMQDEFATKAMDYASRCEVVCDAVEDALVELGIIHEDGDADEAMRPVLATIAKDMDGVDGDDGAQVLVYDDHAIAMLGPASWRIPYMLRGGDVMIGDPDTWQRVEAEWQPVEDAEPVRADAAGAIKILPDGTIIAQAIHFGSPDEPDLSEHRDYFTKATDFWLHRWDWRPMLYHHAMDEGTKDAPVIGEWVKAWVDDAGVWLQGQLDKAHKYHAAIKELARRGLLRISTDSAPHLVVRERQPNGTHHVKTWPIMAGSLTPAPAEPRLLPASLKATLAALGLNIDTDLQASPSDDTRERPDEAKADADAVRRLAAELDLLDLED